MAATKPEPAAPLSSQEFAALMSACGPFEARPTLAIALSGGSDSMALCLLAQAWATQHGGTVVALTVDHGLRANSRKEAELVGSWCAQIGIGHHILTWDAPSHSAVQSSARDARYRLLTDFCRAHHILHLFTAHQREDQSETLFFRLARGSRLSGLACMPAISEMHGVRLLRTLLSIPKARLQATLAARNHPWVEDPTNNQPVYTRNHVRQMIADSPSSGGIHEHVMSFTHSLANFRNLLENKEVIYLTYCISVLPGGYAILDCHALRRMPETVAPSLLTSLIMTMSGTTTIPRSEQLERLRSELIASSPAPKRSFGGLLFIHKGDRNHPADHWLVCREPHAVQGMMDIPAGAPLLWDQRFTVEWKGDDIAMRIGAAALAGPDLPQPAKNSRISGIKAKMALASLPAFWHLEKMIAIPHINYVHNDYKGFMFSARFTPAKPLAGHAFFSTIPPIHRPITKG